MSRTRRALWLRPLLVALVLTACSRLVAAARFDGDEKRHSKDAALFSAKDYHDHIEYLASDALEGRGTGQEGIDKAAEYIVREFKACGVKPAGDDGTYFQNFTLKLKNKIGEGTRLAFGTSAKVGRKNAKLNEDYIPLPFSGKGDFKGEVVFVGYGLSDDDYDDYAGQDVAGKIVLMLRRSPKFKESSEGDARFAAMRGSFRSKASKANAQNAAAVLIVNPSFDEDGDKLFDFNSDSGGGGMMGRRGFGIPMVQIRHGFADKLLKAGGLPSLDKLEMNIETKKKPCSAVLKGVSVKGTVNLEPIETPVRNIVGLIPGTGPQKDEVIILGGHYDHLGIRHKGEEGFDPTKDISNGADDNASGTCLVMTMAKVFTQGARPNRSILLMCFTGEELGLLGSAHFAGEPTIDLDKAVAMLNFDMVGRLKDDKLEVGGMKTGSGFEDLVKKHADEYSLKIKDGGGGRGPSDHTSFYNKKIPVLFFFTGIHKQYHQPTDDTPLINTDGAIRICKFAADIIDDIDAQEERPVFAKDTRTASISRQDEDDQPAAGPTADAAPGRRGPGRGFGNRPRLGFRPDMNSEEEGIVIGEMIEGGAADKAGLKEGDRIIEINGKKVDSPMAMFDLMQNLKWEDTPKVVAMRGAKKVSVQLKFEKPPEARDQAKAGPGTPNNSAVASDSSDVKGLIAALKTALETKDGSLDLSVKVDSSKADVFELTLRFKKQPDQQGQSKESAAPSRPRSRGERRADAGRAAESPHEKAEMEQNATERPTVRLGIMPTYGESEGEGFEIAGVVEGGPAARAGVKDDDRIYMIGDKKVSNIYEYMEALRRYKPGDEVPITVLRKGKQVSLKVKSTSQRNKEAA